jgi:hypothetical protein
MGCAQGVLKPGVMGTGIYVVSEGCLVYVPKALEHRRINNRDFVRKKVLEAGNRIADYLPLRPPGRVIAKPVFYNSSDVAPEIVQGRHSSG